jgi:sugar lactone lactonase YvrE
LRIPTKVSYFVTGSATLALLAGCSGGGSGVTAPSTSGGASSQSISRAMPSAKRFTSHSVLPPSIQLHFKGEAAKSSAKPVFNAALAKNTAATIAISDSTNNVVDVYSPTGSLVSTLTGPAPGFSEPQGMTSDINGDLFVADTANSRIVRYAAGLKGTPTTVSDPGQYPVGVDSFSNGKWLAVTNIISTSDGPGSVSIYKDGALQNTISSPNLAEAFFCGFDATGNLFVTGFDANFLASVGEIANATSGGTTYTELSTSNELEFPGDVQVTTTGSIAVDDQLGLAIYSYNPPSGSSLGAPVQTTQLSDSGDPVGFAFTSDMTDLYTADYSLSSSLEFAYPAGGAPVSSFAVAGGNNGPAGPNGIAVIPTQYPKVNK